MPKTYGSYLRFADWFESFPNARLIDDRIDAGKDQPLCRLPLVLRREDLNSIERIQDELDEPSLYAIILMQAGRASLAIAQGDQILVSKQIQKYMVRMSQGKAQLTYLNEKGKSRLGSRIRLRQSVQFFEEINQRLMLWSKDYDVKTIFLSCSPKLKGAWFQSPEPSPYAKKDQRWKRIPFMVHLPKEDELYRIHRLLCRATWSKEKSPES